MNDLDVRIQQGKRIQSLRKITHLTRAAFAEKHNINLSTLKVWETGNIRELSKKGAKLLVDAFKAEGVICSETWLLQGEGPDPEKISLSHRSFKKNNIEAELQLFYSNCDKPLHLIVNDHLMEPRYLKGDLIAGDAKLIHSLHEVNNKDCIIKLMDDSIMIRHVTQNNEHKTLDLQCINVSFQGHNQKISYHDIAAIAPVMWLRRAF